MWCLDRGDRVTIMLPNCAQYVDRVCAVRHRAVRTFRVGAVALNVNPTCLARELCFVIDRARHDRLEVRLAAVGGPYTHPNGDTLAPLVLGVRARAATWE